MNKRKELRPWVQITLEFLKVVVGLTTLFTVAILYLIVLGG
jgi:hypothetical protein